MTTLCNILELGVDNGRQISVRAHLARADGMMSGHRLTADKPLQVVGAVQRSVIVARQVVRTQLRADTTKAFRVEQLELHLQSWNIRHTILSYSYAT